MAQADSDEQMTGLAQKVETDMDVYKADPQEGRNKDRNDSMVDVEASEISIDTSLDIPGPAEDLRADTISSEPPDSDLPVTDAASAYDSTSDLDIIPPAPKSDEAGALADSSVAPEPALDPAVQKVFATYGLVEQIFLKLPDVKTISLAQRTNKTFQSVIRRSFKIRQRLSKAMRSKEEVVGYAAWLKRRRLVQTECESSVEPSRKD